MPNLVGIDVGLVLHSPTSGLCRTGDSGFAATHSFADRLSRLSSLGIPQQIDLLAIDGPVLPTGQLDYEVRPVEKVLLWRAFQRRCAVGESSRGIGAALRRGGCDTAVQFGGRTANSDCRTIYPQVQEGLHVIEAFPNAFMGVMLGNELYTERRIKLKRGGKFEWLLERWRSIGAIQRLRSLLDWEDTELWAQLAANTHHEEQAGVLCVLSAVCVYQNRYVAVGEPAGGYIFLPAWELWAEWAKTGIEVNRTDPRLTRPVDVWINGTCYTSNEPLPK